LGRKAEFRPRVKKLEDGAAYDPADWMAAMGKFLLWGRGDPDWEVLWAYRRAYFACGWAGSERTPARPRRRAHTTRGHSLICGRVDV